MLRAASGQFQRSSDASPCVVSVPVGNSMSRVLVRAVLALTTYVALCSSSKPSETQGWRIRSNRSRRRLRHSLCCRRLSLSYGSARRQRSRCYRCAVCFPSRACPPFETNTVKMSDPLDIGLATRLVWYATVAMTHCSGSVLVLYLMGACINF